MGCTQITNGTIKNPRMKSFFDQCQYYGFKRSQVVKITEYEFQYCRGSKSWQSNYSKSIFNEQNPVLLSPCLPDNFDNLISGLTNFKQLYPEEFKDFPKNLGMLLSLGDQFPSFRAEKLGSNQITSFQIQQNVVTIFVFWRLEEEIKIGRMSQVKTRNISNRFRADDESQSYLETAFIRAKKSIKRPLHLVGICLDSQDRKPLYEQVISQEDTHIWINENDQSAQVFKYAEDPNYQTRQLEQSIFIVNSKGVFVGCLKENFGDHSFIHEINDIIDGEIKPKDAYQLANIKQKIRKDDYQKVKKLIVEELPNKHKLPIGDTFSLSIKKHTYFRDYSKVGATYFNPIFQAAGSKKYQQNCDDLIKYVKDFTPIAHMETDFKQHHSVNKKLFFEKLSRKLINIGYEDIRFILEKNIEIQYEETSKRFEMKRDITSIHNAPQSVSCVYSRKEALQKLGKSIFAQSDNYTHKELELMKEFFGNPYSLKTSFNVGTLFSPIPNTYKMQHNDFSGSSQIMQSIIRPTNKGIFDSKLVQSMNQSVDDQNQHFGITEQIKSNQSQFDLSQGWDGDNKVDLNYDQIHSIHQINSEVLIIFLIDYTLDKHIELLHQLLEFIKGNQWNSSNVRVIGLERRRSEDQFQKQMNRLEQEMKRGIFEAWFPLEQSFLGVNFYKILSDLYGLDSISPILVIDHLGRLLYQGQPDQKFAPLLAKIINQESLKTIHPVDRPLKHRIDLAQFGREWRIIKQYGNESVYFSPTVQQTLKYLEKMPMRKSEQWKLSVTQFQLWNENGEFVRKCFEKPKIIYKFERPELGVKFYNIVEEIQRLVGKDRLEVIDLNAEILKDRNNLQGEQLIK
ncbi:unnamed protein product (macronuclear) [Paramecium tetraurelia]|uniref:Uncharacterized protein n=1 Tax=Paramecium tetraurelia TaxID=5888 RepID=A0C1N0_PARTE|nr:uncharacterized protein GSPATT00034174001 [Paramecium tetraurelia]CAK64697.1 unnamed protein product [Paramecium tetraurelia]|eukprot:XP_001432094.1 hypothetical protein (macronuclear) [Paramecium tetraurelia strain d4-2]